MLSYTSKSAMDFLNEIVSLPRQTEKATCDYLIEFANSRNLKYYTDEYNNVIIYKNDSSEPSIAFQTNIDMFCVKTPKSRVDFSLKNSICLIKKGDFLQAKDSSFGAGSAIGMSLILELLDSGLPINIEGIFTSLKYNNMLGARQIEHKKISSKRMICFETDETDNIYNKSCYGIDGVIKFNNEKIFLKNDINLKTFKLSINNLPYVPNKNIYVDVVSLLLRKIPHLYINKMSFCIVKDFVLKNEVVFSTLTSERELKRIIKFFYIEQKKTYPKISLKCSRQITNSLVLSNASVLIFIDEFKQGVLRDYEDEFLCQALKGIDSDTGLINFTIMADDEKEAKRQYDNIEGACKKNNYSCAVMSSYPNFSSYEDLGVTNNLLKTFNFLNSKNKMYKGISEGGIFQNEIKKLDVSLLSLPVYAENTVNERVSYSKFINLSNGLKNFFNNN